MNDSVIIARLLAGDPDVVRLVRGWIRTSCRTYQRRLGPELEDLEQEILLDLTVALRRNSFESRSRLRTYVRTYVNHKCIDRLRALGRRQWVDISDLDLPSRGRSALETLSTSQAAEIALRVVEEMPESCRELWQMLQQGMRYREMSERLGVAEGTLRARVLRCRRRALEARKRLMEKNLQGDGNESGGSTTR